MDCGTLLGLCCPATLCLGAARARYARHTSIRGGSRVWPEKGGLLVLHPGALLIERVPVHTCAAALCFSRHGLTNPYRVKQAQSPVERPS